MDAKTTLVLLTSAVLGVVSTPNPSPQYYSLPFSQQQQSNTNLPQDPVYAGAQPWPQTDQRNFTNPSPSYLDPLSSPAAEEILKNDVPRQAFYGPPPYPQNSQNSPYPQNSQNSPYPQIYKLDNLIIIANPPAPQACTPQRLPVSQFPSTGSGDDGLNNRFGNEPSKCTWAIVACCSPGNTQVRYNCFELLGCPGFFFDSSPCEPKIVMAAANAALDYYRSLGNGTTDNNRV